MQVIPTWFSQQLDLALSKYFDDDSRLTATYWPRHLRDFFVLVLSQLLSHEKLEN
jgi:hypothetical protein